MATSCDLIITRWNARYRGTTFPCAVGRGGIGIKTCEGDGITPVGEWRIDFAMARPDRSTLSAVPIRSDLHWCDAPDALLYNQPFRELRPALSAERLFRADPLYDLIGVLNHNRYPVRPGAGSAIFLHVWRKPRHPTEGCVAFARDHLRWILDTWSPLARVIIRN